MIEGRGEATSFKIPKKRRTLFAQWENGGKLKERESKLRVKFLKADKKRRQQSFI